MLAKDAFIRTAQAQNQTTSAQSDTVAAAPVVSDLPWWSWWLSILLLTAVLWWSMKSRKLNEKSVTAANSRQNPTSRPQPLTVTVAASGDEPFSYLTTTEEAKISGGALGATKTLSDANGRPLTKTSRTRFQEDWFVNSRKHCFHIDPAAMTKLQQTAVSQLLQPGTYTIRLKSGVFDYQIEPGYYGEPLVLLWIYGGKVVNRKTGIEVGTTWSSLNGYEDTLILNVREAATLSAFFIDTHVEDNEGEVLITIEGVNQIEHLIVHSQENCYRISLETRRRLEQEHAVSRVLQVGTYGIRIKSGTFNYRTNSGHAGEPLVLLWVYGGKVVNQQTGIEVGATWSTLNGYEDVLWLEVRESATLCAFFFDTYLDDNSGEVVLSVIDL